MMPKIIFCMVSLHKMKLLEQFSLRISNLGLNTDIHSREEGSIVLINYARLFNAMPTSRQWNELKLAATNSF